MILKVKKQDNKWYYFDAEGLGVGDNKVEITYGDTRIIISDPKEAYILNSKGQTIERLKFN